jgi:hypothetical protein
MDFAARSDQRLIRSDWPPDWSGKGDRKNSGLGVLAKMQSYNGLGVKLPAPGHEKY